MASYLGMHTYWLWRGRGDVTCGSLGQLGTGLVRGRSHAGGSKLLGLVGTEGRPAGLWPVLGVMASLVLGYHRSKPPMGFSRFKRLGP